MKNFDFKKIRKAVTSPLATGCLLAAALVCLAGSSVGGARAALTYYSENYTSRVAMDNIGITILEGGERLSWRDYSDKSDGTWDWSWGVLSFDSKDTGDFINIGRVYPEALSLKNTGDVDAYMRVIVTRFWEDADGTRCQELTPDLIHLIGLGEGSGWVVDEAASTEERTILYYTKPVPVGGTTTEFLSAVQVDKSLEDKVIETREQDGKYTVITTTFAYDGVRMGLKIEADDVQTHSAADAIWSAWGRRVAISGDGTLSFQ